MSNFAGSGTLNADGSGGWVSARGTVTLSAHLDSGTPGTLTWEFKGPDGVVRALFKDGTTAINGTASHMWTLDLGGDIKVRATVSGSTTPVWDWQIISNSGNIG